MLYLLELANNQILAALKSHSCNVNDTELIDDKNPVIGTAYKYLGSCQDITIDDLHKLREQVLVWTNNFADLQAHERNLLLNLFAREIETFKKILYFIDSAYSKSTEHGKALHGDNNNLKEGWELIQDSTVIKNTTGYYGQAWCNHNLKQIVIVSAGTKYDFMQFADSNISNGYGIGHIIKDIVNDFFLYLGMIPPQFERGVVKFIDHIVENLPANNDYKTYKVCLLGHSLSALLSTLGTAYILNNHQDVFESVKSITIENPGSKNFVNKYLTLKFKGNPTVDSEKIKEHCLIFNHSLNWMNGVHEQNAPVVHINSSAKFDNAQNNKSIFFCKIINDIINNFEWHDRKNFKSFDSIEKFEKWERGIFNKYLISTLFHPLSAVGYVKDKAIEQGTKGLNCMIEDIQFTFLAVNIFVLVVKASINENIADCTGAIKYHFSEYKDYITQEMIYVSDVVDKFVSMIGIIPYYDQEG